MDGIPGVSVQSNYIRVSADGFKDSIHEFMNTPQKVTMETHERVKSLLHTVEYHWHITCDEGWAKLYCDLLNYKVDLMKSLYSR